MYKVCKTFKVPIGHRLSKHKGLCKNIHGHNLKLEIQISCHTLDENDMVIDFGDLKKIISDYLKRYDHTTLFNPRDIKNINFFIEEGYRIECIANKDVDEDPTAEVFSRFLFEKFRSSFSGRTIDFVRVWENDNSYAEYSE